MQVLTAVTHARAIRTSIHVCHRHRTGFMEHLKIKPPHRIYLSFLILLIFRDHWTDCLSLYQQHESLKTTLQLLINHRLPLYITPDFVKVIAMVA